MEDNFRNDKKVEDPEKVLSERFETKEEKKPTAAESDTNREPEHLVGKRRRLEETKTNRQKQNITDIRKHFDRGLT